MAKSDKSCEMDFGSLNNIIIEALCPGIIAFDKHLRIIRANQRAGELLNLQDNIDRTLAEETDPNIWGNWSELLTSVITSGQKSEIDAVSYGRGDSKKLLHIVCSPLKQHNSEEVFGGALMVEDVTGRVNIERELSHAERFAAVGKVAGKVAHELNNPIDGILRYINLSIRSMENEDYTKPKEYLEHCRSGLMRMIQIISELLEFSRSTYSAFDYIPVDKIIAEAVKAMEPHRGRVEIDIVYDCPKKMPKFRSPSLFQVFCNLIKNALSAMAGTGRLQITIQCTSEILAIIFHDTGPGFAPENAEAIFEPFFTTKTNGKGTGLGLAICKDIIEKYNGRITAKNAPDSGSIFTVHLPLTPENTLQME
jgi:two-component system, NtrC family, sensor kinase